jgi:hypothetical protein
MEYSSKIMIGFSSEQNSTNLISALKYGITHYCLIESKKAKDENWSEGIIKVFNRKGIKTFTVDFSSIQPNDNQKLLNKIYSVLKIDENAKQNLYWNLGGGKKNQILLLYNYFINRSTKVDNYDLAIYYDPGLRSFFEYKKAEDNSIILNTDNEINLEITAIDIFETFGFKIENNNNLKKIYESNNIENYDEKNYNLFKNNKEYRKILFQAPIKDNIAKPSGVELDDFNERLIQIKPLIHEKVLEYLGNQNTLNAIYNIFSSHLNSNIKSLNLTNKKDEIINALLNEYQKIAKRVPNLLIQDKNDTIYGELTKLFFDYSGIKKIKLNDLILLNEFKDLINNNNEIELNKEAIKRVFNGHEKASFFFEDIIKIELIKILSKNKHFIKEVYQNITIKSEKHQGSAQEFDILILTKFGTMIAFDAKTFDKENNKDLNSRLHNFRKSA